MADPRFPGDRGRGADVPLENIAREDMAGQDTNFLLRQIKPPRVDPRMPSDVKRPPVVQKIGADLPPLTGDPGKDLPPLTGDLSKDVGVQGPLATAQPARATERPGLFGPEQAMLRGLGAIQSGLGKAAAVPFRLAGKLDTNPNVPTIPFIGQRKTPEQAESRAQAYGGFTRDLAQAAAVPWSKAAGAPGMLARMGQAGGLQALQTQGGLTDRLTAGIIGAGVGGAGDLAAKGVRSLFSAIPHKLFSEKSGKGVANWLRQNVPAWKNEKNLYDMARGLESQAKLSDAYEKSLLAAADKIPQGVTVNLSAEAAKRAGFTGAKDVVDSMGQVAVDARRLLTSLPNLKSRTPELRHEVLDALHTGLPPGSVPDAAFKEYAFGKGWIDFAKKSGLFDKGKGYSAALAQEALRQYGPETLGKRGMAEVGKTISGPLAQHIKPGTMSNPAAVVGGILGALGGGSAGGTLGPAGLAGGGGLGAAGGSFLGGQLGKRVPTFKNVPETLPQIGHLRRALLQALAQQAQGSMRSTGQ